MKTNLEWFSWNYYLEYRLFSKYSVDIWFSFTYQRDFQTSDNTYSFSFSLSFNIKTLLSEVLGWSVVIIPWIICYISICDLLYISDIVYSSLPKTVWSSEIKYYYYYFMNNSKHFLFLNQLLMIHNTQSCLSRIVWNFVIKYYFSINYLN